MKIKKLLVVSILISISQLAQGQKTDDNIGSEVVNVVKPYTPTISDAFKVKETPSFDDDETGKKEKIEYNIFSFPVASTFAPNKGKATGVDKEKQEKYFNSYATLGAGNYGTINAELFVTHNFENNNYFGAMLRHLSSQGGIENVELNDAFYDTGLDLSYGSKSKTMSWNIDGGFQNQIYNWYGMNPSVYDGLLPEDRVNFLDTLNVKQSYNTGYIGTRLNFGESTFKELSFKYIRFWDAFESGENRFFIKPNLEFKVANEKVKANFVVDYISGNFKKDYYNLVNDVKYGFTNIGFQPSFQINQDDVSVNLGAGFFYSLASNGGKNKFFVYPQITASYKLVGDLMIAYAGAEGTLKQNSYRDYVQENFFVSPTLAIAPTDQKFDLYLGLKGKLANTIGYNIRGSYLSENGKAMFKSNVYDMDNANLNSYTLANSFYVVQDNVKTVSFFGELKSDFSKNFAIGINGTFSSYTVDIQKEAWNLPAIKLAANLSANITPKWYAGSSVFFTGERKDEIVFTSATADIVPINVTLPSYVDVNAHIGYKHNERMSFFLKGNNLTSQNYQKWLNYPVQSIQVLIGANYKFDF